MTAISAPFGLRCVYHPSGEPRIETLKNGVASGYATALYNGTPVKISDDGTLVPTNSGPDSTIGIFSGCFFIHNDVPQTLSYWPAGQTYDAGTVMWAQYQVLDPDAIYEAQANGSVSQIKLGEAINLAESSTGSNFSGQSTQTLDANTTGATPGTFIIQNIAPYSNNAWGDDYTILRVRIGTFQGAETDPLVLAFDFANNDLVWGRPVSVEEAITCVRADSQIAVAQNFDGTWNQYAANVARVPTGRGLLVETRSFNICKYSHEFLNAAWLTSGITIGDAGDNPISGTVPIVVVVLPPGTTTWTVPANVTILTYVAALAPGGNGAAGVINTRGGGGGGGGSLAITTAITVVPGTVLPVQVSSGGSGLPCFFKDTGGSELVFAEAGANALTNAAGLGGLAVNCVGTFTLNGGNGGAGSNGTGNRGGGGGAGAGNHSMLGGTTLPGRTGGSGGANGGGGGGALGGGITAAGGATAGVGGVGGTNIADTGGGTGGTPGVASGDGADGGGGGGGSSGTGINAGAGSTSQWNYASLPFTEDFDGSGGGGGGGGLGGNGGIGGLGAGGGGGGATAAAAGTGAAGGDGTIVIVYGASNAARLTATGANATLRQVLTTSVAVNLTPSILIRPVNVTGPILLSQDDGVKATDISSQLIAGRYQQCYAPYDALTSMVWRLEIVNSGDVIDVDLAQLEDNENPTSPILTQGASGTRQTDLITLNINDFPSFINENSITVEMTVWPGRYGLSVDGAETNTSWTWCSLGGFGPTLGTVDMSGVTGTPAFHMDVTDTHGIVLASHQGLSGAGFSDGSLITAQTAGSTGGIGTYSISPSQALGAGSPDIIPGYAYIANAANNIIHGSPSNNIGLTVVNGATALSYGFDPQIQLYVYKEWNRCAFTTSASLHEGVVALAGDITFSVPKTSWAEPPFFTVFQLGSQSDLAAANVLGGWIANLYVYNRYDPTGDEIAAWTALPYP